MKLLLSEKQIQAEVRNTAFILDTKHEVDVVLCTLSGAVPFFSDVIKKMSRVDFEIDFIKSKSYVSNGEQLACEVSGPFGSVQLKDKNVVVVEDMVDTGKTLVAIANYLLRHNCKSITFVTLLRRSSYQHKLQYTLHSCFTVDEGWLVGYGLDDNDKKRNLPNIYLC
jgi:hypoxanthine phosphoribosyltransferase